MGPQDFAELLLVLFVLVAGFAFQSNNRTARLLAFWLAIGYAVVMAYIHLSGSM